MRIGIDARLLLQTGVGRYIRSLLCALQETSMEHQIIVYCRTNDRPYLPSLDSRFIIRSYDVPWHSIAEQIIGPIIFLRDSLDVLHVPYINLPILYPKRFVVTLHDCIPLTHATGKASRLPGWMYDIKRRALRIIVSVGLRKAAAILCVSESTKQECVRLFPDLAGKATVVYQGIDTALESAIVSSDATRAYQPYIMTVGNAYPHKNLDILYDAFMSYNYHHPNSSLRWICVGPDDIFYAEKKTQWQQALVDGWIVMLHAISDQYLASLYHDASAVCVPSHVEGFGLSSIEALLYGVPVIASDIPVFRETLDNRAIFVDPNDVVAWEHALESLDRKAQLQTKPASRIRLTKQQSKIIISPHSSMLRTQHQATHETRNWIRATYNWKTSVQRIIHMYEDSALL